MTDNNIRTEAGKTFIEIARFNRYLLLIQLGDNDIGPLVLNELKNVLKKNREKSQKDVVTELHKIIGVTEANPNRINEIKKTLWQAVQKEHAIKKIVITHSGKIDQVNTEETTKTANLAREYNQLKTEAYTLSEKLSNIQQEIKVNQVKYRRALSEFSSQIGSIHQEVSTAETRRQTSLTINSLLKSKTDNEVTALKQQLKDEETGLRIAEKALNRVNSVNTIKQVPQRTHSIHLASTKLATKKQSEKIFKIKHKRSNSANVNQ